MIGLTLWITIISYTAALVFVGTKVYPWKRKFIWWGVLLAPLAVWLWDWPIIKFQHEMACRREGGLKVLIEPEKADRIQLDGGQKYFNYDEKDAKHFLVKFYPQLKTVVAKENNGPDRGQYFAYSIGPISTADSKNEPTFTKTPTRFPVPGLYVLTDTNENLPWHGQKRQISLMRDGKLYAKSTWFRATWNSSGVLPNEWQCHSLLDANNHLINLILN